MAKVKSGYRPVWYSMTYAVVVKQAAADFAAQPTPANYNALLSAAKLHLGANTYGKVT